MNPKVGDRSLFWPVLPYAWCIDFAIEDRKAPPA